MQATGQIPAAARLGSDGLTPVRRAPARAVRAHGVPLRLLAFGGALLAWLAMCAIVASALLWNARAAVREETLAAFRLANAFATLRLPTDFERRDMMAEARRIGAEIETQRHVTATLRDAKGAPVALPLPPQQASVPPPGWFSALLRPEPQSDLIPIAQYPNVLGVLEIRTDPSDEIAEAWADVRLILPLMAVTALAAIGVTMAITGLVLRRLGLLGAALGRMRAGDLAIRAPHTGLSELAQLSDGVNALASHLADERAQNRRLQARMMTLAEAERARIASDLHDGIGPQLFALQAAVGQAGHRAETLADPALSSALDAVSRHAGAIRQSARAAIDDLRLTPAEGASLAEMLQELVIEFSDIAPEVEITLEADPDLADPDEAGRIALYRFVRESVLNALRHAAPSRLRVVLGGTRDMILARVEDDGRGPTPASRKGLGQAGMQDRARALLGSYQPPRREAGLTITECRLPGQGVTDFTTSDQGPDR